MATAVGDAARRAGIDIFSCHGPFGEDYDPTVPDEGQRRRILKAQESAIRRTALAGAKLMVLHPGNAVLTGPAERSVRLDRLRSGLEELLPVAENEGVTVALENLPPGWLCDGSEEILKVVESLDSPALGVCLDTGHAHLTEEGALSALKALSSRIVAFHVHDNDGSRDLHLPPPYGTIDWEPIAAVVREMNFENWILIEASASRSICRGTILKDAYGLFEHGFFVMDLDGRKVRAVCPQCGRYVYGDKDRRFCACT